MKSSFLHPTCFYFSHTPKMSFLRKQESFSILIAFFVVLCVIFVFLRLDLFWILF